MTTTQERPPVPGTGGVPGAVGVVVLGCCAVWALISSALGQGRPEGVLLAVLAVVAGYACGRIGGSAVPAGAAAALALAAGAAAAVAAAGSGDGGGRAGEVAALLALAQGAPCCAASAVRGGGRAWAARLLVVAVVGLAAVLGSPAGCAATAAVALCALGAAASHGRGRGPVLLVCAVVAAAAVAGVCAVAHGALSADGAVPTQRVAVWHEAVALAREHPVTGAGPDRFGELGPTVAAQASAPDGEAHSAPLQEAAEQGVVGLALLAGVYVWMLYGLARSPRTTPVAVSAGAALTCLAVLASASDALSFAPVAAAAGALAGLGTADPAAAASDWMSTRLNSRHPCISDSLFCS
ncbi:O-antigen ligase family protein [Streptomyces bomunensis]|uniref:O-antigen ligase family protein n=1 Tax=Streptomyces montanisoli TaxID=2798581 RepID=A0A940RWH8_9ACTN|nr:O-antigen ligase family protein [Streptomyces montanisoli]